MTNVLLTLSDLAVGIVLKHTRPCLRTRLMSTLWWEEEKQIDINHISEGISYGCQPLR
jgi:hypothetical protein